MPIINVVSYSKKDNRKESSSYPATYVVEVESMIKNLNQIKNIELR